MTCEHINPNDVDIINRRLRPCPNLASRYFIIEGDYDMEKRVQVFCDEHAPQPDQSLFLVKEFKEVTKEEAETWKLLDQ